MADDLRAKMRAVLPIDPDDGTIPVAYDGEGAPVWGRPAKLVDDLVAVVAEWLYAEADGARSHGALTQAEALEARARTALTQPSTEEKR